MSSTQTTTENLLDIATQIAISASKPDSETGKPVVNSTTINNLLTFLQSKRDVNMLLVYIMRQTGRGEIDENTGKLLLSNLKDKTVENALQLLGYVKWIFETINSKYFQVDYNQIKNVKKFRDLVNKLSV